MLESITISFDGDNNIAVDVMRILSLYLAALRCERKLKSSEVSEQTGIHLKNLKHIETGIHLKNLKHIETGKTTLANHDIGKLLNYYGLDIHLVINNPTK